MPVSDARVILWGTTIGAVSWLEDREIGVFQYAPDFLSSGIELSPLMMPLKEFPYEFPSLARNTFKGLPGLLSDSLPDKFGNAIIDAWLASQNRTAASFHPVERLCYIGTRGMGALEFEPSTFGQSTVEHSIEVEKLVGLANKVLDERTSLGGAFSGDNDHEIIQDILRVGTSAGGARAKAILAWNSNTNEFKSGQVKVEKGFEQWLMKFDGVSNNRDKELADPMGYGKIEYVYYQIALLSGIEMSPCRLHHESGRSHFMTKRFDRTSKGEKLHMQSLAAIAHFDYNQPASYSYEQALNVIKRLDLPKDNLKQQVLRAMFNVVGRNRDDHVKNIAFLMNKSGEWSLSPAFDISYAWDPNGQWTSRHQMSINGKRENITREDLLELSKHANIKKRQANEMLDNVISAFLNWPKLAFENGIAENRVNDIQHHLHLDL